MGLRILLPLILILGGIKACGQKIVDPCFASVSNLGFFYGSKDLVNICTCIQYRLSADMIEWDGTKWLGTLSSEIDRPPPEGCNMRALWIGYAGWTPDGEAFGLRLDKPLVEGTDYTFSFTYAKESAYNHTTEKEPFSPIVYTDKAQPDLRRAIKVGRLPATVDWTRGSITFTATAAQAGHEWLIIHAVESSGIILSDCELEDAISRDFLQNEETVCMGDSVVLTARGTRGYSYLWSTGESTSSIIVWAPGLYKVEIESNNCFSTDSVEVSFNDCEIRFEMPNVFTPNGDSFNPKFVPKESNMIDSATVRIYNRWGELLFSGDALKGWDGTTDGAPASPGVYFYIVNYVERNGRQRDQRGSVSLIH